MVIFTIRVLLGASKLRSLLTKLCGGNDFVAKWLKSRQIYALEGTEISRGFPPSEERCKHRAVSIEKNGNI